MENAPDLVKSCYKSVKREFPEYKITVLTAKSIQQYVTIPEEILYKWNKGIINNANFSDVLRVEILSKYPELKPVLEKLNNILDDKTMADLNYQVESEGKKPEDVAREYLQEKGLLEVKQ